MPDTESKKPQHMAEALRHISVVQVQPLAIGELIGLVLRFGGLDGRFGQWRDFAGHWGTFVGA